MSLSCLPTELLVHIFKLVDNVCDAAALSRTSHHFHAIYKYNLSSICDAVLPRSIEAYDQAAQLVEARTNSAAISSDDIQTIFDAVYPPTMMAYDTIEAYDQAVQLVKARAKPKITSSQSSTDEKPVAAVVRAKKLFADVHLVHSALRQFEMGVSLTPGVPPELLVLGSSHTEPPGISSLEPFTRARFLQGYYRGISVIYLKKKTGAEMYQFLESMSLLDLFRMCEVMIWLRVEFTMSTASSGSVGLNRWPSLLNEWRSLPGHVEVFDPLVGDEEHYSWRYTQLTDGWGFLLDLVKDLETITGIAGPEGAFLTTSPDASRFIFISHGDGPNERAKKAEGVALADVLPLLPAHDFVRLGLELPGRH